MLTRMYRTGCRQHYSRRSRTSSHKQIHYKRKKIEQHTFYTRRNVARKVIKRLKPTKRVSIASPISFTYPLLSYTKTPRFHISVSAAYCLHHMQACAEPGSARARRFEESRRGRVTLVTAVAACQTESDNAHRQSGPGRWPRPATGSQELGT